jgi:hypothetical protein
MKKIDNTLIKIKDEVALLLRGMYPELLEAIEYHKQEHFQEWFAFLFEADKWQASTDLINIRDIQTSATKSMAANRELETYQGLPDLGYMSVVLIDGKYHLIDGYHRVLLARERGFDALKCVIWKKELNMHQNCQKIKQLIINNL